MKIGIDARLFGPRQGGLGRYLEQLIRNLEQLNIDADFVIFLRKNNWDEYTPKNSRFTKVLADVPWYGFKEQFLLPGILKKQKLDLIHFPHWNVPLLYRGKFVVTIHDLLLLHYPSRRASTLGPLVYFFKNFAFRIVLKNAIKKAAKIITISEFSKQDILSTLSVASEKIIVTHLAPRIFSVSDSPLDGRIKKPFALYVGVAFPHKNLPFLLEAWSEFNEHHNGSYQLVLAGNKNYFYEQLLNDYRQLFESGSVVFTDFVSDETLAALYQKAHLFVYPSLYEGFGLPPLEAMGSGSPVVCSNYTSLPEVVGQSAVLFDPTKKSALLEAFERIFTNHELRSSLAKSGQDWIKKFSWKNTAKQTSEVYKNSV